MPTLRNQQLKLAQLSLARFPQRFPFGYLYSCNNTDVGKPNYCLEIVCVKFLYFFSMILFPLIITKFGMALTGMWLTPEMSNQPKQDMTLMATDVEFSIFNPCQPLKLPDSVDFWRLRSENIALHYKMSVHPGSIISLLVPLPGSYCLHVKGWDTPKLLQSASQRPAAWWALSVWENGL